MNPLRTIAKNFAQRNVVKLKNLVYLGSDNQGYFLPDNYLSSISICYCVGAGTDISLDVELVTRFNARVFIFDPMPYAFDHFNNLVASVNAGKKMTADNAENGYVYRIKPAEISTITYCATGVWNEKKMVKFYSPVEDTYAGHSITNLQKTEKYIEAPVDNLVNIMRELGHTHIDLLKIEIEGAEYTVIDNVLADKIDVKIMLIEFDEFHHRKGLAFPLAIWRIEQSSKKLLKAGYKLVHSSNFYKRTFMRSDVFERLTK